MRHARRPAGHPGGAVDGHPRTTVLDARVDPQIKSGNVHDETESADPDVASGVKAARLVGPKLLCALAAFGAASGAVAASSVEIHYAPQEDLERVDVDVIDNAERSIDMAAYVLSDPSSSRRCATRPIAA